MIYFIRKLIKSFPIKKIQYFFITRKYLISLLIVSLIVGVVYIKFSIKDIDYFEIQPLNKKEKVSLEMKQIISISLKKYLDDNWIIHSSPMEEYLLEKNFWIEKAHIYFDKNTLTLKFQKHQFLGFISDLLVVRADGEVFSIEKQTKSFFNLLNKNIPAILNYNNQYDLETLKDILIKTSSISPKLKLKNIKIYESNVIAIYDNNNKNFKLTLGIDNLEKQIQKLINFVNSKNIKINQLKVVHLNYNDGLSVEFN